MFCLQACLYTKCMQCPKRSEEGIRSPRPGATDSCEHPHGFWEVNSGPSGRATGVLNLWPTLKTPLWVIFSLAQGEQGRERGSFTRMVQQRLIGSLSCDPYFPRSSFLSLSCLASSLRSLPFLQAGAFYISLCLMGSCFVMITWTVGL